MQDIRSVSMWHIVNQLGKHDFSYGSFFIVGR